MADNPERDNIKILTVPQVNQNDIENAQKSKTPAVGINNAYSKALRNLNQEAKSALEALEKTIKAEEEKLKALEVVHLKRTRTVKTLAAQDKQLEENIKKQTRQIAELKKSTNNISQNPANAPAGGPPPPPPMAPPPPVVKKAAPLTIKKKSPASSADSEKAKEPESFNPADIGKVKLRSSKDKSSPRQVANNEAPAKAKLSNDEQIAHLKKTGQQKLDEAYAKHQRAIEAKQKTLASMQAKMASYQTEIVELDLSDSEPVLVELVELEEKINQAQNAELHFLETKEGLLKEIEEAKKSIPLPEPVVAPQVTGAAPPPPPMAPPPPPSMASGPKKLNIKKGKKSNKATENQAEGKPNLAANLTSSDLFLKLQQDARERERLQAEEEAQREKARKEAEAKAFQAQLDKVNALLEAQKRHTKPNPEAEKQLKEYQARLTKIKQQASEIKVVDHSSELNGLRKKVAEAQEAQQEDYKKRLAERDGLEYTPPAAVNSSEQAAKEEIVIPDANSLDTHLSGNNNEEEMEQEEIDVTEPQPSLLPQQQSKQSSHPQQPLIPDDKKKLVKNFLDTYKVGYFSNKDRKTQLALIKEAFDQDNETNMDKAIDLIRQEMFEGKGTEKRQKHETRKLGKSKMEKLVKDYLDLAEVKEENKPRRPSNN